VLLITNTGKRDYEVFRLYLVHIAVKRELAILRTMIEIAHLQRQLGSSSARAPEVLVCHDPILSALKHVKTFNCRRNSNLGNGGLFDQADTAFSHFSG